MRVLVAVASKHGATEEIADAIAEEVQAAGHEILRSDLDAATHMDDCGAAVIGSAVYAGHWLKEARTAVERLGPSLRSAKVYLFSSGPVGDPPKPDEDPVDVADMMEASGAVEHVVFAGRIERARLGFAEKAVVSALRVPDGDFRDWDAIRSWARHVAEALDGAS